MARRGMDKAVNSSENMAMLLAAWRSFYNWITSHEYVVLVAVLAVVVLTWGFIQLADEVKEGSTKKFDEWALRTLRNPNDLKTPIGPAWLAEVGRDMTALGGVAVLFLVTIAVVGFLYMNRTYGAMWLVIVATVGGLIISTLLKGIFHRDRPDVVPYLSHVITTSFPSGHSMLSATVYLTLGTLLARLTRRRSIKIYILAVALLVTFLVGVSRVFMGVHYPTDVLAGWAAGLVWAILCWLVARYLQRRGAVETVDEPPPEPREPPAPSQPTQLENR
ncbi:MAG TPA: phosphatase PAP2 family protein [Tepidisphaeraceae bacterium]|jgi:undecaprenyl-diphosphatase